MEDEGDMLEFGWTLRVGALRALLPTILTASAAFAVAQPARAASSIGPATASPARRAQAGGEAPKVRAVFFFSPTCPHCEKVIQEDLPGIFRQFGGEPRTWVDPVAAPEHQYFYLFGNEALELLLVDVLKPESRELFMASFPPGADPRSMGVPRLVIGSTVLVGDVDIPARLPVLAREGLKRGGIDWPPIAGLDQVIARIPASALEGRPASSEALPPTRRPGAIENFRRDPVGNGLSVLVLVGMLVGLAAMPRMARRRGGQADDGGVAIAVLALAGMAVAAYLTYVEAAHVSAVCGPVGDCNTVQQSPYAMLFGTVPVGMLGLVGYAWILAAWLLARLVPGALARGAMLAVWVMATLGTLFSIYLTFLEPFVIGATCVWCLTSAVVITALMLLSAGPALDALHAVEARP